MKPEAIIGLVRSRLAYMRDYVPSFETITGPSEGAVDENGEPLQERVFDVSALMTTGIVQPPDWMTVGRKLPFPMFAMVGIGNGVFIIRGDEGGFYCYCYTAPVPLVMVRFTPFGVTREGLLLGQGMTPQVVPDTDERVSDLLTMAGTLLTFVERACENTKHVVSYTLNRAERRSAAKATGIDTLDTTVVHRVCLSLAEKRSVEQRRGATVVPTPKRLHEVRSHDRHLKSGVVVRVRAHRRGKRGGDVQPRVYVVSE